MSYIGNSPIISAFPADQFNGNGSTTAFTLSVAPANTNSIIVVVSGILQDPSTYSVNGTTLTFSAAPPSGTNNISVRYLGIPASGVVNTAFYARNDYTATAGQTTFSVPSYTVPFIQVLRNGVTLGTADYTATSGTSVVLANAATAGDLITVISFYVASVANAIPNTANAVSTTNLNDASVTQAKLASGVAGNGPAFSVYHTGGNQSVSHATYTKIAFNTETFDTASCFDSTTNYRFTPNVAGYYYINLQIEDATGFTSGYQYAVIYKNGSVNARALFTASVYGLSCSVNTLVYLNGSTDYIEGYYYQASGSSSAIDQIAANTYMVGGLVRAA